MRRLNFVVEGETEEAFVNLVLRPHLSDRGVYASAQCVMTRKQKRSYRKGGLFHYAMAKRDLQAWLSQDHDDATRFTTMFDLYALPEDFPGFVEAKKCSNYLQRAECLEAALNADT